MKSNMYEYKGYHTKIEFNSETCTLRGKIDGIKDLVNFESQDAGKIEEEFHNAVDDYLEFCKEVGKEPEKEYKGVFNVRISPELHRSLALVAYKNGETLNSAVEAAIKEYVTGKSKTEIELQETIMILSTALATQSIYDKTKETSISMESKILPFGIKNVNMKYQEAN